MPRKNRKSRAKPPEEHKKRGRKAKNENATDSSKKTPRSGAKPGPKPKSADAGKKAIYDLTLSDLARDLIYKKEGKPVPPRRVLPTPQTSAWVTSTSKIKDESRPPTLLAKKIKKSSKLDSWGEGSGGWLPEVIPQKGGD